MILGFSGRKRSGKSQAAAYIRSKVTDTLEINFGDALKVEAYDYLIEAPEYFLQSGYSPELRASLRYSNSQTNGEKIEWVNIHKDELRPLLQDMGHGARLNKDPDYWVKIWTSRASTALENGFNVVCGDVRYPNEVQAIRDLGGMVVRITKAGQQDDDSHPSENQEIESDAEILNTPGRTDQLHRILDHTLARLEREAKAA